MRVPPLLPLLCYTVLVAGCDDAVAPPRPAPAGPPQLARTVPMGFVLASIDAGAGATCGLTGSGRAYCWGTNSLLGTNSLNSSDVPVAVAPPSGSATPLTFTSVSVGATHACGIVKGGQAYCWGTNYTGELGTGSNSSDGYPMPVAPPAGAASPLIFTSLSAGISFTCGVAKGGQAYCWGYNTSGELGIGTTGGSVNVPTPVAPPAGSTTPLSFSSVSAAFGFGFACGVTRSAQAYCWGTNFNGQLGDGSTSSGSDVPVPVGAPLGFTSPLAFASVSAGAYHVCGLTTGAHVYCWGYDGYGGLGDGSTGGNSNLPVPVASGAAFTSVSAGTDFTCGATRSGQAYCWGYNTSGQLGNGTFTDSNVPVPISGGFTFTAVSAGTDHACGLAGKLGTFCWGGDFSGQLGNGAAPATDGPSPVVNP